MQSRLHVILIALFCVFAVAERNRHTLPVGLLYQRGCRNVDNILKRSLMNHISGNSKYNFRLVKEHYTDAFSVTEKVCTLLNKGVMVIVAMIPPPPARIAYEQLSDMSNAYRIPLITYSLPDVEEEPYQFSLMIKPSTVRASLDMMQYYGWKNMILVKDDRIDSRRFQIELELRPSPYNFTIDGFITTNDELDAVASILSIQDNMTSEEELDVVINASPHLSRSIIFTYAKLPVNKRIHFLIVEPFLDSSWTKRCENKNIKLTTFNLVDPKNEELQSLKGKGAPPVDTLLGAEAGAILGVAIDHLYKFEPNVFNNVTHNQYLSECPGSLIVPLNHGLTIALEIKRNVTVEGYTGNLEFNIHGRRKNYTLHVIETTSNGNNEICTWSDRFGLKIHSQQMQFPAQHIFSKLSEKRYIITSILEQPYLAKHSNDYIGFCQDLIDLLADQVKFSYDIKLVDDGFYGSYNNYTGKWNGMIGEIVDGKADMAVAPLTMTSRRRLAVEFTVPFQNHGITLLMKKSKESPSLCHLVFCPFTWQLWIFILCVYFAFGILSILISHYVDSPKHENQYEEVSHWYTRSWSLRILLLVCLVFTAMIISMYIASLGVLLSHQQASWSNASRSDFKDVFKKSILTGTPKMLLLNHGSIMSFFQRSKMPLYRKYWNQVAADPSHFVSTYQEGIQRVLQSNGETALFLDSAVGEYLCGKDCDLHIASGFVNIRSYAIALHLNHPLRQSFDKAMLVLRENESLDKLYAKWWKSKCSHNRGSQNTKDCISLPLMKIVYLKIASGEFGHQILDLHRNSIELMEMDGLFYMLIAGIILIVVIAAGQLFYQKRLALFQSGSIANNKCSNESSSHLVLCYKQSL